MRMPSALTNCKVTAGVAVALMGVGTAWDLDWVARWSLLIGILAVAMCLRVAVHEAAETIEAYVKRWSLDTFEHGMKQGIDMGREIEAAEKLIASSREPE